MAEYYVTTDGTDHADEDGSSANPWASIGYAGSRVADGDTIYIQAGSYSLSNNTENTSGGPFTGPATSLCWVIGYEDTKDDGCPTGDRPVISANSVASVAHIIKVTGQYAKSGIVCNIEIDGTDTTTDGITGSRSSYSNCKVSNCVNGFKEGHCVGCFASECTKGFSATGESFLYCWADSCSTGFEGGSGTSIVYCLSTRSTVRGMYLQYSGSIANSTVAYQITGDAFVGYWATVIANSVACDIDAGYAFSTFHQVLNSAHYSCGSGRSNNVDMDIGAITLTSDPFDSSTNDYEANAEAAGGELLKGAGFVPWGLATQTANIDVGAVQHADPAGGGDSWPYPRARRIG